MPKVDHIEPHLYWKGGHKYWRVLIPKALRAAYNGKRDRFFHERTDAVNFASELSRGHSIDRDLLSLDDAVKQSLLRAAQTLGPNAVQVDLAATEHLHQALNQPKKTITVKELAPVVLKARQLARRRPRTVDQLRSTYGQFTQSFGARLVHTITPQEVRDWVAQHEQWSPKTRRNKLLELSVLFHHAVDEGLANSNPVARIKKPGRHNDTEVEEDTPPCVLTPQQLKLLLRAALDIDPELVPYITVCTFAGVRPGECRKLRPEDIWMDEKEVVVSGAKSKTRRHRGISMQPVLHAWLDAHPFKMPLPNLDKRFNRVLAYAGLIRILRRRRASDLPASYRREGRGWEVEASLPHLPPLVEVTHEKRGCKIEYTGYGRDAMRHSFGSYRLKDCGNDRTVAVEMGHGDDTATLFAHYRRLVRKSDASSFWAVSPEAVAQTPMPEALVVRWKELEAAEKAEEQERRAQYIQRRHGCVPVKGGWHNARHRACEEQRRLLRRVAAHAYAEWALNL
jgi:integrase